MNRPKQSVFVIEGNTTYTFDAVIKSEAKSSNKVAEDAKDVNGKSHVNYAMKAPTTIQMEVSVSDTVTATNEPLTKGGNVRSVAAYRTLKAMCERRNLLTIVTEKYTYTKMIMENLSLAESKEYQDQAHMDISFKEMIIEVSKQKNTTTTSQAKEKPAEQETTQSPSVLKSVLSFFTSKLGGSSK